MKNTGTDRQYRWYRLVYVITVPLFRLLFRIRCAAPYGVPEGAAIVCANHSHWSDPFFTATAFGIKNHLHFMGKVELFKSKLLRKILNGIGSFQVTRGESDIGAIKSVIKYTQQGEKVVIYPEGTRVSVDDAVEAKTGAVRLASRLNVPIVPVYIPRTKKLFKRHEVVVGKPYMISEQGKKLSPEKYREEADVLMRRITELGAWKN